MATSKLPEAKEEDSKLLLSCNIRGNIWSTGVHYRAYASTAEENITRTTQVVACPLTLSNPFSTHRDRQAVNRADQHPNPKTVFMCLRMLVT
jgi:hypothetical protein